MKFVISAVCLALTVTPSFGSDNERLASVAMKHIVKCDPRGYSSFNEKEPCFDAETKAIKIDGETVGFSIAPDERRLLVKCNSRGYNPFRSDDMCYDSTVKANRVNGEIIEYAVLDAPSLAIPLEKVIDSLERIKRELTAIKSHLKE